MRGSSNIRDNSTYVTHRRGNNEGGGKSSTMVSPISDAMPTPRSGSRKRNVNIDYGGVSQPQEVDAIRNPTGLFQKINSGHWKEASEVVKNYPSEASTWISRRMTASSSTLKKNISNAVAWKYLPLHLVCLQKRPPLELLLELLQAYPPAASLPTPHDGNLPIHYVCESGCEDENVLEALLNAFPQSLEVKNGKAKTPLLLCHARSRQVLMNVLRRRKHIRVTSLRENEGSRDEQLPQSGSNPIHHPRKRDRNMNRDRCNAERKGVERRNAVETYPSENTNVREHRQPPPPQTVLPPLISTRSDSHHHSDDTFDFEDTSGSDVRRRKGAFKDDDENGDGEEEDALWQGRATPTANNRSSFMKRVTRRQQPLPSFGTSSSGEEFDTNISKTIAFKSPFNSQEQQKSTSYL